MVLRSPRKAALRLLRFAERWKEAFFVDRLRARTRSPIRSVEKESIERFAVLTRRREIQKPVRPRWRIPFSGEPPFAPTKVWFFPEDGGPLTDNAIFISVRRFFTRRSRSWAATIDGFCDFPLDSFKEPSRSSLQLLQSSRSPVSRPDSILRSLCSRNS